MPSALILPSQYSSISEEIHSLEAVIIGFIKLDTAHDLARVGVPGLYFAFTCQHVTILITAGLVEDRLRLLVGTSQRDAIT